MVVVDQAQMRTDTTDLATLLDFGFMVIVSGSKFYTGPAFAGALLVPPNVASIVDRLKPWPSGFADYLSAAEVPNRWRRSSAIPAAINAGLLLRWAAALWEMQAFQSAGVDAQHGFLRQFGARIEHALSRYSCFRLVPSPVGERLPIGRTAPWHAHAPSSPSWCCAMTTSARR